MKIFTPYILYLFGLMLFFAGCDDLHDVSNESNETEIDEETAEVYILNEGLFNLNNSSLARYSFKDGSLTANYFSNINKRGLGDTANDMQLYGSKLYVVVNVSSEIEVIDFSSGKSLKQIPMVNEKGVSRQPRYITFAKGNAYVCSFDGTVARIDTTSLTVDGLLTAGRNPDGICTANGKLYVSNSGGLDAENIGVDHTVSVIDLYSFTETKKIDVGPNPGKIIATVDGTVYVVTRGQNIKSGDYHLVAIDSKTDNVIDTLDEKVLNLAVNGDIAYMYQYNYKTSTSSIKAYSLKDNKTLRDNFITDGTKIQTPYAINVNPYSGNVYIADAYDYTSKGDLLCFNPQGVLQFRLKDIGLNPNTILFTDQVTSNEAAGGTSAYDYAYADSVLEYCPAPTQYMNTSLTAYKEGYTANDVLREATTCLKQKTTLTLGAFGGYVIVGFNHTVKHVSGEYDFKIFGNAYTNEKSNSYGKTNGSAEPGIVWVSQDTNGNGKPDDEWYEIAGSEYGKSSETRDYTITYYRPSAGGDVKWTDNKGNSGYIYRNEWHTQSSYYPLWMADKISFNGTRLADNAVNEGTASSQYWVSYPYDWGYADNYPNNTEYSNIKLDWAVDSKGNKVNLPGIDFIKVTTAVNQNMGWMGEASTEILTIQDLHYNN